MNEKPNIWELIENEQDPTLNLIIKGHLYIEYLLNMILQNTHLDHQSIDIENYGFFKKVTLLKSKEMISEEMRDYLLSFNKMRNNYAHNLKFHPDYEEAYKIAKAAQTSGIHFKDKRIFGVGHDSKDHYSIYAIFFELIINTFQEIIFKNPDTFSKNEVKDLMINTDDTKTIV